jgi:hypothetical protein
MYYAVSRVYYRLVVLRRYAVWFFSAGIALPVYALATTTGLSNFLILFLTFIGAIAGTVVGTLIMRRLSTRE